MTYEQFANIASKYSINITNAMYQQFNTYYNYLREENEKYNLTTIIEEDDVFLKHFLDSLIACKYIPDNCQLIDIGCGAGFPSVPIKIIRNDIDMTLIDAVNKKVNFVNTLCSEKLKLSHILAMHARCEDIAKTPKYREKYDIVVARAVASLNVLLEYAIPFLKVGGKCVLLKSKLVSEEISQAKNALKELNASIDNVINYNIAELDAERSIVIITKTKPTPSKYPRQQNKARKMPL